VTSRSVATVLFALLLALAGCAAPVADSAPASGSGAGSDGGANAKADADATAADWQWPDDPPTDRLGWEAGYWYNESIAVNQTDGLDPAEREAFVARTMARVERIRGLEFEASVSVEVLSREAYRDGNAFSPSSDEWDEQTWEALLLVGEDETVADAFDALYGSNVLGYYSPSRGEIVVVSDSPTPAVDRATLAHELVHALQDQQFGLPPGAATRDGALARNGLVEGDARYVERLYVGRCASGEWECVATPPRGGAGGGPPPNEGVLLTVLQPYSDGPTFVDALRARGGWDAVNAAYDRVPESTEQVIHPERYPDEAPVDVAVPDRSNGRWRPVDHAPQANTLGEASLYVMLREGGVVPGTHIDRGTGAYSYYNYSHPRSDGWGGDSLVPYTDGSDAGYVWALEWDSERDAREFASGYETALKLRQGARVVDRRGATVTLVVDAGPFADAFRVTRDGTRVVIVNAPTVDALDGVRAP
jgi:hypothetical protein